ncbi:LacI family transcriptional regulator [Caballeronia hypogeia]|uniref:LacI family transcriptional regulator n=1 Tax=Caballeronia hypogeia TaxID=1777140 RepID=A0A158DHG5_9BURK|nr:LacI family DNA-binding transcriptional regulator [Caballeronia hypogeia]SAK94024.1 LacI family transcriptional regulator [Caballeronia hypogeia]
MTRPTIPDLAEAAGVSVATVNRVLSGTGKVRQATAQRVVDAAQQIGFYGLRALQHRVATTARPAFRFGIVLQSPHRPFTDTLAGHLERAAAESTEGDIRLRIEVVEDLSPERAVSKMTALSDEVDALAVVAPDHPIVSETIDRLAEKEVPVLGLVSPLSARVPVGYVGLDSWKVGRASAWALAHTIKRPGKLAVLVGTHRFRNHDLNESGFRSYFRENEGGFVILEPISTFESDAISREVTEGLLRNHPDLTGMAIFCGGVGGVLAALKSSRSKETVRAVAYDLFESTIGGLVDHTLTMVVAHPYDRVAREAIAALVRTKKSSEPQAVGQTVLVPFELHTVETI